MRCRGSVMFFKELSAWRTRSAGASGFVGEFMVILASFQAHPMIAFAAAITLIIGAGYTCGWSSG